MGANEKVWHNGGCHCGAVSFEVQAKPEVVITDCNCTVCSMTGFQHLFVSKAEFNLLTGENGLQLILSDRVPPSITFAHIAALNPSTFHALTPTDIALTCAVSTNPIS